MGWTAGAHRGHASPIMKLSNPLTCFLALSFAVSCKSPDRGEGPWNPSVKVGTVEGIEEFEREVVAAIERHVEEEAPGLPIRQLGTPSFSTRAPGKNREKWPDDIRVSYRKSIRLTDSEINKWWGIFNSIGKHHGIDDTNDEFLAQLNQLEPAERASAVRSMTGEAAGKEVKKGAPGLVMVTFVAPGRNQVRVTYLGIGVPTDN